MRKILFLLIMLIALTGQHISLAETVTKEFIIFPHKTTIHKKIFVDESISFNEMILVNQAVDEWNFAANGIIQLDIMQANVFYNPEAALIKNVSITDDIIKDINKTVLLKRPNNILLGYFWLYSPTPIIFILEDRMKTSEMYRLVLMHEIGHYLGLMHSEDKRSIMFESTDQNSPCLTKMDMSLFCYMYGCNIQDVNYCE